jgi:hypothetical protein
MTEIHDRDRLDAHDRVLLDEAINSFRKERVWLIREGGDEVASNLTVRAARYLSRLAREARKAHGVDGELHWHPLRASLATTPLDSQRSHP